jgi:P-type Ca2+ transporter type 2C
MLSDQVSAYTLPYQGLTAEQVEKNRHQYGINVLTPPARDPWWKLFLDKFSDPVIRILIIAAVIAISIGIVQGEYLEGLGIIVAILLATTLAFFNEYRASQEFELLNQVYDQIQVKVIRDGSFTTIPRKDLVVDDIVYVEQGEEVPADGMILEEVSLYIDQSKITGESEPVKKFTKVKSETQEIEKSTYSLCHLYRSTIVAQGHSLFQVIAVGDHTEIGKVANAIATVETGEATPLNRQLEKLSQIIGVVGLSVSGLTFFVLVVQGLINQEFSLTPQQGYFVILIIFSTLVMLCRVWLSVVYDALSLVNVEIDHPPWLKGFRSARLANSCPCGGFSV